MVAILNFWKKLKTDFCCLIIGNIHDQNEKDPANKFRAMHSRTHTHMCAHHFL